PGGRDRSLSGDRRPDVLRRPGRRPPGGERDAADRQRDEPRRDDHDDRVPPALGRRAGAGVAAAALRRAGGSGKPLGRPRAGALVRRVLCILPAAAALALALQADAATTPPLSGLVVPRSELGRLAAGLQVSLISGEVDNARAANESYDDNATPASVARAGRVSGYRLIYGDPGYEAIRRGSGLIDLGTSLEYFKTARQAAAYELKWLADLRRARGRNLQGVVVERISTFPVGGLGPLAIGLRITERFGSKRMYLTYVDFQIAGLLCESAIRRGDPASADAEAVAVARLLATRISRYASGKLKPKAVTLPRPL